MKSVELIICDSNFPVKGCSVCAKKRDKLSGNIWRYNWSKWDLVCVLLVIRIVLVGEDL